MQLRTSWLTASAGWQAGYIGVGIDFKLASVYGVYVELSAHLLGFYLWLHSDISQPKGANLLNSEGRAE